MDLLQNNNLPEIRDIWAARQRISRFAQETPLVFSAELSERFAASVYLKLEFLQPTGSFKLRGAANKVLSLSPEERQRGIATFSTGNHGLAVAYVARELGVPAFVYISSRVPDVKVENLRAMGANVIICGATQDDAEEHCSQASQKEGLTLVQPFDDPFVVAGQGTIGLELLERCPQLDTAIIPVSGGGLASGIALALKSNDDRISVIGVSMKEGAVMFHSLQAGKPVILDEADTLADSLLGGIGLDNNVSFPLVQKYVDEVVLVSEAAIASALTFLYKKHRMVVEGAAATTVAAAVEHDIIQPGSHTALILSGNNVDTSAFLRVIQNNI